MMNRRTFAFTRTGTKGRKPAAKQPAPINRATIGNISPITKPVKPAVPASDGQVKTAMEMTKAGKFQESFAILKEVVKAEPNNAQVWLFLGIDLGSLKDYVNAERCLQRAKALGNPKADQALEWLKKNRDRIQ
jgi:predicted Zn-dependent protease